MGEEIKIPENKDIEEALREFEMKSNQEDKRQIPQILKTSENPKLVELVMKYSGGLVKDQRQAEYVLLGFVVLAISVSVFLFYGAIRSPLPPTPDQMMNIPAPGAEF